MLDVVKKVLGTPSYSWYGLWVLVTPLMLWSHFTYHLYSYSRISSPRLNTFLLSFLPYHCSVRSGLTWTMAMYRRSASGHGPHKSMSHVMISISGHMTAPPTCILLGQHSVAPTQCEEPLSYGVTRRLRARDRSGLRTMRALPTHYGCEFETVHTSSRAIRAHGLAPTFSSWLESCCSRACMARSGTFKLSDVPNTLKDLGISGRSLQQISFRVSGFCPSKRAHLERRETRTSVSVFLRHAQETVKWHVSHRASLRHISAGTYGHQLCLRGSLCTTPLAASGV